MPNEIYDNKTAQKVLLLITAGAVFALAGLTAGLPATSPFNGGVLSSAVNQADTAWMIVACSMGFLVSPALALFNGQSGNGDHVGSVHLSLVSLAVVGFFWIVFTFSLVWGPTSHKSGIMSYIGTYYMFSNVGPTPDPSLAATIPLSIFAIYELVWASLVPAILAGHFNGRVTQSGWAFFVFVYHICVWVPLAHVVWNPNGQLRQNYVEDYAGGIVIHICAGVSAFAGDCFFSWMFGPIKSHQKRPEGSIIDKNITAISTMLVFFGWFALTAGKAYAANSVSCQAVATTAAAVFASIFTWGLLDFLFDKSITPLRLGHAVVLGLVAISPGAGFVNVGGAFCIAITAVCVTYPIAFCVLGEQVHDTKALSAISLHGIAGIVGFLCTAIFSYSNINMMAMNGLTYGRGIPLAYHISALLVLIPCIFIATLGAFFVSNLIVPLDSSPKFYDVQIAEDIEKNQE